MTTIPEVVLGEEKVTERQTKRYRDSYNRYMQIDRQKDRKTERNR